MADRSTTSNQARTTAVSVAAATVLRVEADDQHAATPSGRSSTKMDASLAEDAAAGLTARTEARRPRALQALAPEQQARLGQLSGGRPGRAGDA